MHILLISSNKSAVAKALCGDGYMVDMMLELHGVLFLLLKTIYISPVFLT